MLPIHSDRTTRRGPVLAALTAGLAALPLLLPQPTAAQGQAPPILSHDVRISRDEAELRLELEDGRVLTYAIRDGQVYVDGRDAGEAPRGEPLDRSWRELLSRAMDLSDRALAEALIGWDPEGGEAADRLDAALEHGLAGIGSMPALAEAAELGNTSDTVARLLERIDELESRLEEDPEFFGAERAALEAEIRREVEREIRGERRGGPWFRPLGHVVRGLTSILSTLATYAVLAGIGLALVFFGRKYVEGVADTARHATLRSGLVGLAAIFLSFPAWIIGMIALAISIVGIPLLLVWVPVFPFAVALTLLFGYLAVAHAAGESLAERRLEMGDWFKYGNSYYYMLTGLGLLAVLFAAAGVVQMAGPWLGFIRAILLAFGTMLTVAAVAVGVGAALISRGGTRPIAAEPFADGAAQDDLFAEETHV